MFVDPERCEKLLNSLKKEGVSGAVIGEIVPHTANVATPETTVKKRDFDEAFVCTVASGGKGTGKRIEIEL
jgi:hydrogenase maturation factor